MRLRPRGRYSKNIPLDRHVELAEIDTNFYRCRAKLFFEVAQIDLKKEERESESWRILFKSFQQLTWNPSYVQLPNLRTQVCSSKGKYSTSISQLDL